MNVPVLSDSSTQNLPMALGTIGYQESRNSNIDRVTCDNSNQTKTDLCNEKGGARRAGLKGFLRHLAPYK